MARVHYLGPRLDGLKKEKSLQNIFVTLKKETMIKRLSHNCIMATRSSYQISKNKQRNRKPF